MDLSIKGYYNSQQFPRLSQTSFTGKLTGKKTDRLKYLTDKDFKDEISDTDSVRVLMFCPGLKGTPDHQIPFPDHDPVSPDYEPFLRDTRQKNKPVHLMYDRRVRRGVYTFDQSKVGKFGQKPIFNKGTTIPLPKYGDHRSEYPKSKCCGVIATTNLREEPHGPNTVILPPPGKGSSLEFLTPDGKSSYDDLKEQIKSAGKKKFVPFPIAKPTKASTMRDIRWRNRRTHLTSKTNLNEKPKKQVSHDYIEFDGEGIEEDEDQLEYYYVRQQYAEDLGEGGYGSVPMPKMQSSVIHFTRDGSKAKLQPKPIEKVDRQCGSCRYWRGSREPEPTWQNEMATTRCIPNLDLKARVKPKRGVQTATRSTQTEKDIYKITGDFDKTQNPASKPGYFKLCDNYWVRVQLGFMKENSMQTTTYEFCNFYKDTLKLVKTFTGSIVDQSLIELEQEQELDFYEQKLLHCEHRFTMDRIRLARLGYRQQVLARDTKAYAEKHMLESALEHHDEMVERMKIRAFTQHQLQFMISDACYTLGEEGAIHCATQASIKTEFIPWVECEVSSQLDSKAVAQMLLDGMLPAEMNDLNE